MKIYRNKTLGSALLVAGTQIGAGMLALPLTTGVTGFFLLDYPLSYRLSLYVNKSFLSHGSYFDDD